MKKIIYALIILLVVVSGSVFAYREINSKTSKKPSPRPLTVAEKKAALAARKAWEASPDGIRFKLWEASPEGKKIYASAAKIRKRMKGSANIEAVVTTLSLPPRRDGSQPEGNGLTLKIDGETYIVQLGSDKDAQPFDRLKVNDKIIIRSSNVGYSPNHSHVIIGLDRVEQNGKKIFERDRSKDGC